MGGKGCYFLVFFISLDYQLRGYDEWIVIIDCWGEFCCKVVKTRSVIKVAQPDSSPEESPHSLNLSSYHSKHTGWLAHKRKNSFFFTLFSPTATLLQSRTELSSFEMSFLAFSLSSPREENLFLASFLYFEIQLPATL